MARTCPHCHRPLQAPDRSDFESMPERDRERLLEALTVRKAGGGGGGQRRPQLARFELDPEDPDQVRLRAVPPS